MRTAAFIGVMLLSIFRLAGYFNEPRLPDAEIHAIAGEPARLSSASAHPGATITLVSWNIERGVRFERIFATLRVLAPDVILLQEADRYCRRSGDRDVARDLAQALGMNWIAAGEFQEIGEASGDRPAIITQAILSRQPISDPSVIVFADQSWRWRWSPTQPRRGGRIALRARTAGLDVVNLHLESQSDDGLRRLQLEEALACVSGSHAGPAVFAGDFNNATDFNPVVRSPRMFAGLAPAGFVDALANITTSRQTSINHQHPIDWIFVRGFVAHRAHVERVDGTSDHYPVVVIGSLTPTGQVAGFGATR